MKFFKGCDDGVHRFEGRYDKIAPVWTDNIESLSASSRQIDAIYNRLYVRDVCVRCGITIERQPALALVEDAA